MTMRPPEERANRLRLQPGSPRGHAESYFLKANDPDGSRAFWLKFTFMSPAGKPEQALAEVWAIVFDRKTGRNRAAKESFPFAAATTSSDPFRIEVGGSMLETGKTRGAITTGAEPISWDLGFTTRSQLHRPLPFDWMYRAKVPRQKLVTPYPDERFAGVVEVGDRAIEVAGWPGMQGHNWGSEHTFAYAWCHCNVLGTEGFFEGFSGKVKLGPVKTPWLTLATLAIDGRRIHFDGPSQMLSRKVDVGRYFWRFAVRRGATSLEGEAVAERDDMMGLTYENPGGPLTYCLNSKLARLSLELHEPGSPARRFESDAAALELGTRDPSHGVRMVL
ncbi:MAG: hypothetical protein HYY06_30960 [Deltaproteobacteria bacterium]|nr:hypothetical protein [Deltaproteobacteria bacterium]